MNSVYSVVNMRKAIQLIIDKFEEDEAFHLINIDDIVNKYEEFQEVLPQVLPFYGKKNFIIIYNEC